MKKYLLSPIGLLIAYIVAFALNFNDSLMGNLDKRWFHFVVTLLFIIYLILVIIANKFKKVALVFTVLSILLLIAVIVVAVVGSFNYDCGWLVVPIVLLITPFAGLYVVINSQMMATILGGALSVVLIILSIKNRCD